MDRSQPAPAQLATDAVWQLDLLGQVRLRNAQAEITRWPSRAVAALLARLALAPQRAHPREELIELLWPGVSLDKGRPRLRQALSLLRGLLRASPGPLPEALLADRLSVRIHPQAVACDVLQFERQLAAGAADRARALYAGDLMPGYYEEWIVAERHRLLALADGLPSLAHRARPADPALAMPQSAEQGLAAPPRLPAYWTRAFGQQPALAQLQRRLQGHRLVTVVGPGGNGKTRLAVAVAGVLADTLPAPFEQVVFVPLADAHDPQAVWASLAQTLADEPSGDPARQVRACIGRRALLLVLDNVEQLDASATGLLTALLQDCPGLHLLLTSRRRLGLPGEQVFEMPGLPLPDAAVTDLPDRLQDNAALALFVDRARESRPEFQLGPHNAAPVVALVRLLGGMPLAIELAASRLRALQPRELLDRLQHDGSTPQLDLLARPAASAGSRHASMRHVVAWSWRQLRPEVATLLRAMSVFGAPATAAAVAQALAALTTRAAPDGLPRTVDGLPDDPPAPELAQVQVLLAEAVDASLVQTVAAALQQPAGQPPGAFDDGTLYSLLPPVREYAAEQCSPAEPAALRGRLRRWLAALARQGLPRHREALQSDLRHAWRLLLQARDDAASREALALTVALQGEMNWRPSVPALLQLADWALAAGALADRTPARPGAARQDALTSQGHYLVAALAQLRAQTGLAARHAEQAVATAPDARSRALALSIRAWVAQQRGDDPATVQPGLAEALDLARRGSDARVLAMVLRTQAEQLALHRRDDAAAEPLLRESVRLFEQVGDGAQAWMRQTELAACWARSGRLPAAQALLQACLRHRPAMGTSLVMIYALTELGRVQLLLRQPQAAQAALNEAIELALQHDWPSLLMPALLSLPQAWVAGGQAEPAALLHGHVLASWPALLGRFNALDALALRRMQRLLSRALGPARAGDLQLAGQALTREQALQLVADTRPGPAGAATAPRPERRRPAPVSRPASRPAA